MIILAQLDQVSAQSIKDFLMIIGGLVAIAAGAMSLFRSRREKREITPQPLGVEMHQPCAKQADLQRHIDETKERFDRVTDQMNKDRSDNQVHASERSKTIFAEIKDTREKLGARIDPLVENTAALKAGMEAQTRALTDFTGVMSEIVKEKKRED